MVVPDQWPQSMLQLTTGVLPAGAEWQRHPAPAAAAVGALPSLPCTLCMPMPPPVRLPFTAAVSDWVKQNLCCPFIIIRRDAVVNRWVWGRLQGRAGLRQGAGRTQGGTLPGEHASVCVLHSRWPLSSALAPPPSPATPPLPSVRSRMKISSSAGQGSASPTGMLRCGRLQAGGALLPGKEAHGGRRLPHAPTAPPHRQTPSPLHVPAWLSSHAAA